MDKDRDLDEHIVYVEITDSLDLHHFSPKDLKTLIPDYLDECVQRGFTQVRIIHGKGKGQLRRSVHAILDRQSVVTSYKLADETAGSWGATLVSLSTNCSKEKRLC